MRANPPDVQPPPALPANRLDSPALAGTPQHLPPALRSGTDAAAVRGDVDCLPSPAQRVGSGCPARLVAQRTDDALVARPEPTLQTTGPCAFQPWHAAAVRPATAPRDAIGPDLVPCCSGGVSKSTISKACTDSRTTSGRTGNRATWPCPPTSTALADTAALIAGGLTGRVNTNDPTLLATCARRHRPAGSGYRPAVVEPRHCRAERGTLAINRR